MTFAAFRIYFRFWRVLFIVHMFYCDDAFKRDTQHFQRPGLARAFLFSSCHTDGRSCQEKP